jgi:hypothetical protein
MIFTCKPMPNTCSDAGVNFGFLKDNAALKPNSQRYLQTALEQN